MLVTNDYRNGDMQLSFERSGIEDLSRHTSKIDALEFVKRNPIFHHLSTRRANFFVGVFRVLPANAPASQVAGGASVITSRALTEDLSPHLEPWYEGVLERSKGNVNKAAEEDKFHDISFQR